jgi:predicted esterase
MSAARAAIAAAVVLAACRSGAPDRGRAIEARAGSAPFDASGGGHSLAGSSAGAAGASHAGVPVLPPIPPDPLFTNLGRGEGGTDVLSVPNGATSPRPVIVVLHGSADRPDWNCDAWRHITGARGFVLCPRGELVPAESTPGDARYTVRGGAALLAHLDDAFALLRQRFGPYTDDSRPLAAGFSLGATEIAQVAIAKPGVFSRVALLEGGHTPWTAAAIRSFAAGGGRRVLFGCGSPWCLAPAEEAARRLRAGGVDSRVVHARVGHTTDPPLQEAIMRELAWFVDDDARWAAER